jgi:hypothetical protein
VDGTYAEKTSETSPQQASKIVAAVDRYFFCGWIGFYLVLPVSGWASVMFASWFDQKRDLAALRSVLETGHADEIARNGIGPAYIGAAAVVHYVSQLSPEDSLVLLTRGGYVLSVALGVLLVRALLRSFVDAPPLVTIGAQLAFMGLIFGAGTWHWSDVPWSHFFAAFLAAAIYAIRFVPQRRTAVAAAALGSALALLWLTRSFEFAAVILAWGITALVLFATQLAPLARIRKARLVSGTTAFLVTTAAVYLLTGKRNFFLLYGSSLDTQSGNVSGGQVATTPTFSWSFVPTKLVQLFVEPCYYALCSVSDYAGGARPLPADLTGDGVEAAGNTRLWRLPLAVQLPSLVVLPLCIVAVLALVVWALRRRRIGPARVGALRGLMEMTVASAGLVVGYAASTLTGSPHLRYGFARDFLLPALLCGIVAITLAAAGLWLLLSSTRQRYVSSEFIFVMSSFAAAAVFIAAFAYARADGIPRLKGRQLGAVVYTATCRDGACEVTMSASSTGGRSIDIPEASTLTFGCGTNLARFTLYSSSLNQPVRLERTCARPRLVAAWPTIMGLPPGSYELAAVQVRNA